MNVVKGQLAEAESERKEVKLRVGVVDSDLRELVAIVRETRRCVRAVDARAAGLLRDESGVAHVCRRWCPSCTMLVDDHLEFCYSCEGELTGRYVGRPGIAKSPSNSSATCSASSPSRPSPALLATQARLAKPLAEQYARFDAISDSGSDIGDPIGDLAAAVDRLGVPYELSEVDSDVDWSD